MTNEEWIRSLDFEVMRHHLSRKCPPYAGECNAGNFCGDCWRNWQAAEHVSFAEMTREERELRLLLHFFGAVGRVLDDRSSGKKEEKLEVLSSFHKMIGKELHRWRKYREEEA